MGVEHLTSTMLGSGAEAVGARRAVVLWTRFSLVLWTGPLEFCPKGIHEVHRGLVQ